MPQLGETVTEGTVTRWLKSVGDKIEEDEALFEVSTDKVDSEVPSPASGYLAEILVQEGETVDVGAKLAVVTAEPPGQSAGGDGSATQEAEAPQEAPREQAPAQQAPSRDSQAQGAPQAPAQEPPAPEPARPQAGQQASQPQAEQRPPEQPPRAEPNQQAAQPPQQAQPAPPRPSEGNGSGGGAGEAGEGASRVLSPVVRRLLAEHHLDPSQIRGTGAGGRITRSDVLAAVDQRSGPNVGAGQPAVAAPPPPPPPGGAGPPPPPAPSACGPAPAGGRRAASRSPARRPPGDPGPGPPAHAGRPGRGGSPGRDRPLHQHPPAHGRAHGAVQGHLGPHPRRRGGGLRGDRGGPAGPQGPVPGRGGYQPLLPALHRQGRGRRHQGVPPPECIGR